MIDRRRLADQLTIHEGLRLKPYRDSVGKLTVGIGRNLDDVGISASEARYLLENDITRAENDAMKIGWYGALDEVRQNAVVELIFNMGYAQFPTKWPTTAAAFQRGDYKAAAAGLRGSKWYGQVGPYRGERIARMVETGHWPA